MHIGAGELLVILALVVGVGGGIGAVIGSTKGRPWVGFVLGCLLNWIGWVIAALLPAKPRDLS